VVCDGNSCEVKEFQVEYDRLVVTVGAQTNTFGIPGVRQYCCFLKQIEDARRIRTSIVNLFERANLPSLTDEEKKNILTFAVIGAGPTGIEFAAELRDFVEQDGPKYYPQLLKHVRIKVIEASSTVLAPFDKSLQEEAIKQLSRSVSIVDPDVRDLLPERFKLTELLLDSSVREVGPDTIHLNDGRDVPYGLAVWAAGNGPLPLALQLIEALGDEQAEEQPVARGRLAIDPWMRVIGSEGTILAFGDCSCITRNQLPATAQVAAQQGEYLAGIMNRRYDLSPPRSSSPDGTFLPPTNVADRTVTTLSDAIASFAAGAGGGGAEYAKPFQFLNMGILAYTGGATALAQITPAPDAPTVKGSGKIGNALWRSVYLTKQVSWRNRLLVVNDWATRRLFGRDITRL
jgi:NADH dehydrogenase FAD-containing subunit